MCRFFNMAYTEGTFFWKPIERLEHNLYRVKVKGTKDKWVVRMLYTESPGIHLDSFNLSFRFKSSFILNLILKVKGKTKGYLFYENHFLFEKWCEENEVSDLRSGRLNPTFLKIVT